MGTAGNSAGKQPTTAGFDNLMSKRQVLVDAAAQPVAGDPAAWLKRVKAAAGELFEAIDSHRSSTEDEGGTLSRATVRKPGLMFARQRLEHEHADLLHRLSEIEVEAERQIAAEDYNLDLVRLQTQVAAGILVLHLARTYDFLFEAYVRVEGGEAG